MRIRRIIRWALVGVLLAVSAYVTATELIEAYGAGPPFYNRTTNMDKWANPWLLVVTVDLISILLIALLLRPRRGLPGAKSDRS